jgi:hypothetical protein
VRLRSGLRLADPAIAVGVELLETVAVARTTVAAVTAHALALRTLVGGQLAVAVLVQFGEAFGQTRMRGGLGLVDGAVVVLVETGACGLLRIAGLRGGERGSGAEGGQHGHEKQGLAVHRVLLKTRRHLRH